MTPEEALKCLLDGNVRYVQGTPQRTSVSPALRTDLFTSGQHPYAVILGCSDSRVPVETVFDAGPGELFVIRTAGNVIGPLEMGSLEYAVLHLETPLVLVLGHQQCGAVRAAIDGGSYSPALRILLEEILPSVPEAAADNPYETCENENIRRTLSKIAANPYIDQAVSKGAVRLAAAKYSLETGEVSFF